MAKFSKRHYEVLAAVVRRTVNAATIHENAGIDALARELGTALAADNPAFDWLRFATKAGLLTDASRIAL